MTETANTVPLIFTLIPKIMSDVGAVEKGRKNAQQGYEFRGVDDVIFAVHGSFVKHGVFFTTRVMKQVREERPTKSGGVMTYSILNCQFRFFAPDGSCVECETVGEAMDSGDKASNKAMSAALKYALLHLLCIPTKDDKDTENDSPETVVKQAAKPQPAAPKKDEPSELGVQGFKDIMDSFKELFSLRVPAACDALANTRKLNLTYATAELNGEGKDPVSYFIRALLSQMGVVFSTKPVMVKGLTQEVFSQAYKVFTDLEPKVPMPEIKE